MKFLAAAIQMLASDDKTANLQEAERWVRQAASEGARVVALPEVFIWRGNKQPDWAAAERIPGPTTAGVAVFVRELRIHLIGGVLFVNGLCETEVSYKTHRSVGEYGGGVG